MPPANFIIIRHKPGRANRVVATNANFYVNEAQCKRLNAANNGSTYSTATWEYAEENGLECPEAPIHPDVVAERLGCSRRVFDELMHPRTFYPVN